MNDVTIMNMVYLIEKERLKIIGNTRNLKQEYRKYKIIYINKKIK